jgi:hypothetical protein
VIINKDIKINIKSIIEMLTMLYANLDCKSR